MKNITLVDMYTHSIRYQLLWEYETWIKKRQKMDTHVTCIYNNKEIATYC